MTQYIAETPLHCVVRSEVKALHDTAGRMVAQRQRRVYAKFRRGEAPIYAREYANAHFEFRGMPGGVTKEQWLAFYDSEEDQLREGWTDEERQAIEERLANVAGVTIVEAPVMEPPFPGYDKIQVHGRRKIEHVAEKIAEMVKDGGYDVEHVLAYEAQKFARPEVISALHALQAPVDEPAEAEVMA